ncbi:MAG: c-type cytochrome [Deltaproteobacteria bacterium]|nr:c-type cytochrome [Deltaproteobacteria bacterium]
MVIVEDREIPPLAAWLAAGAPGAAAGAAGGTPTLVIQPPDPALVERGAKLFVDRTCLACHGKDAKTPIMPTYPKVAGQNAAYAEQQMRDIKAGVRANGQTAAMKGIMPLVDDKEIPALAAYLSTLPR